MAGRVVNATTGATLADAVCEARSPWHRAIGLLFRKNIDPGEGIWLRGCAAIHTIGMRTSIDLIFLDRGGKVVRVEYGVRPGRLAVASANATQVIELGCASAPRQVSLGDHLQLEVMPLSR